MKNLVLSLFLIGSAVSAQAGAVNFTPPQAAMIEEPAPMGGSGAWIVPLVIVAVIVLAVTTSQQCTVTQESISVDPCR